LVLSGRDDDGEREEAFDRIYRIYRIYRMKRG